MRTFAHVRADAFGAANPPRPYLPSSADNAADGGAADGGAADLSDASEPLAGNINGSKSDGSSDDGSSEQETECEPVSDLLDAN
jgi:hypothetical protein